MREDPGLVVRPRLDWVRPRPSTWEMDTHLGHRDTADRGRRRHLSQQIPLGLVEGCVDRLQARRVGMRLAADAPAGWTITDPRGGAQAWMAAT